MTEKELTQQEIEDIIYELWKNYKDYHGLTQEQIDKISQEKGITAKFTPEDIHFLRYNEPVFGSILAMKIQTFYYDDIIDVEKSSAPEPKLIIHCKKNYDVDEINKFVENEVPINVTYEIKEEDL